MAHYHHGPLHKRVPGTSRYEWKAPNGEVLQYRNVHLKPFVWELLADLARAQNVSASQVIEQLVTNAAGYRIANPRQG
jgi:macrodomain Ter protein organizer (MatP/YcbG family)